MRRISAWKSAVVAALATAALGAAPAPPSYMGVESAIGRIQDGWRQPGARPQPNAAGWDAFFDGLKTVFATHSGAQDEATQLRALDRLYQYARAMSGVAWAPAVEVREALRDWLRPRIQVAWAERRLVEAVRGMTPAAGAVQENRDHWVRFVDDQLGSGLRAYEGATSVIDRQAALFRIQAAIQSLEEGNRTNPWSPSRNLQAAMDDLFNRPNLDLSADVATLAPLLNQNIATSGPIFFKGQWTYATAGPKLGFGLMHSDQGIAFYNTQALSTVTPIAGFQEQVASDSQGKRAAKLYQFDGTSFDSNQLTIVGILGTNGLHLLPSYVHSISAAIGSTPTPGKGLTRFIASVIGLNQSKITQKVYDGAIGQIQQGVTQGAQELASIKATEEAAKQNVRLQQFLVGDNTLAVNQFAITDLSLRSRPQFALIGGKAIFRGPFPQGGADSPEPKPLASTVSPGVGADLHLPSLLNNFVPGLYQSPLAAPVQNIMVVTRDTPPDAPPADKVEVRTNVNFDTYAKEVADAKAANNPNVQALLLKKPGQAPTFGVDAQGRLVVLVRDFQLDVPAPAQAERGGGLTGPAAKVYRLTSPLAELTLSFKVVPPGPEGNGSVSLKIENFEGGPQGQVLAILDDEAAAVPLTNFTGAIVLRLFSSKLQSQPIDAPLDNLPLRGFTLDSVSDLDPSGWIRTVLTPIPGQPLSLSAAPAPAPTADSTAVQVAGSR